MYIHTYVHVAAFQHCDVKCHRLGLPYCELKTTQSCRFEKVIHSLLYVVYVWLSHDRGHISTRLYFTSESLVHAVLNALRYGAIVEVHVRTLTHVL